MSIVTKVSGYACILVVQGGRGPQGSGQHRCLSRVQGSFPGLGGLKEIKMFLPHPLLKLSILGSLHDREVAYSASKLQGSNFESSVSSHHPQEVILVQFSLYVHKSGLKPDSFHFICRTRRSNFSSLSKITFM